MAQVHSMHVNVEKSPFHYNFSFQFLICLLPILRLFRVAKQARGHLVRNELEQLVAGESCNKQRQQIGITLHARGGLQCDQRISFDIAGMISECGGLAELGTGGCFNSNVGNTIEGSTTGGEGRIDRYQILTLEHPEKHEGGDRPLYRSDQSLIKGADPEVTVGDVFGLRGHNAAPQPANRPKKQDVIYAERKGAGRNTMPEQVEENYKKHRVNQSKKPLAPEFPEEIVHLIVVYVYGRAEQVGSGMDFCSGNVGRTKLFVNFLNFGN